MPFYEYHCEECGVVFEQRKNMCDVDVPTTEPCPTCQEKKVMLNMTAPPFIDSIKLGIRKPPADFQKHVLGRIQNSIPNNVIGKGRFGPLTKEI